MAKKSQKTIAALLANETIVQRDIVEEMETSGLAYAVMTYTDRAIPDIRDGLKPVQRRILYSMWMQGMRPDRPTRKSAGVTGDVMRWLHPHGSSYDALCNMVNDFEIRYPAIDGQGNFGSPDGDPAAAERYTECRLSPFAMLMLQDIDKYDKDSKGNFINGVVDFKPNYAEEEMEPMYLPAAVPYLLLNGAKGIATAYSTDSPSHNMGEVIDAVIHLLKNPKATLNDLMQHIKGPDLPTGAYILNTKDIKTLYETGEASLRFRAKIITEVNAESGNTQIVITELPPGVRKSNADPNSKTQGLVEKLYELCIDKKEIPRVIDIRDESEGKKDEETGESENLIRIVLELHKTAVPKLIIDELYKRTPLERTYGYKMRALIDKAPRILSLQQILESFIEHRRDVVTRRIKYDLAETKAKLHIVEGKLIAYANVDEVIRIIRFEDDVDKELNKAFGLSDVQIKSIRAMRLDALRKLVEKELNNEADRLRAEVKGYEDILSSTDNLDKVIIKELREIKKGFADERKTIIIDPEALDETVTSEEYVDDPVIVALTNKGNIKQLPEDTYNKALKSGALRERQEVFIQAVSAKMNDNFVLVTDKGNYVRASFTDLIGSADFFEKEQPIALFKYDEEKVLISFTSKGYVKKTEMKTMKARNKRLAPFMELNGNLIGVRLSDGNDDNVISLATKQGIVHRFFERGFTSTSPGRAGVPGISLSGTDEVVDFVISKNAEDGQHRVILYSKNTDGVFAHKAMELTEFTPKGRMSKGIVGIQFSKKETAEIFGLQIIDPNGDYSYLDPKGNVQKHKGNELTPVARYTKAEPLESEILVLHF